MLITIVTESNDFYKQVIQIIPSSYRYRFECVKPESDLKHAKIIITDGCDASVYEEDIPTFVIADSLPKNIRESASVRLYKRRNFFPETLVKDISEWIEIIEALEDASNEVSKAEKREDRANEKLADYEANLKLSGELQKDVMMPNTPDDFELSAHYQSIAGVSGDILLVEELGNKIYVVIGDATDHGYLAGLYGASIYSAIKSYLTLSSPFNSNLESLVRFVQCASAFYQPKGYGSVRQRTSATMLFCEIDKEKEMAHFINCGHGNELPVFINSRTEEANLISFNQNEGDILPAIGDFTSVIPSKTIDIEFKHGDCLVFYTDGITEIFKDVTKKKTSDEYSSERLLSSVRQEISKSNWSTFSIINGVKKDAESYSISAELNANNLNLEEAADDVTILALKWN